MTNIIIGMILILPWVFLPVENFIDQMRLPKMVFFDMGCIAIIAVSFIQGQKFQYKNKYFGWMFIVLMFGFFENWFWPMMTYSDNKRLFNLWNLNCSINIILAFFASFCVMSSVDRKGYIQIAKAICLSAVLVSVFGILQAIGFDPMKNLTTYHEYENNHVAALLDHPNMLGNFLALSIPFFLFFETNVYLIGGIICLSCLLFTQSSISIIAFFLSVSFYFLMKFKNNLKLKIGVIALFLILAVLAFKTPSFNKINSGFSGRIAAWQGTIEKIKDNPVFGQGIGKFASLGFVSGVKSHPMRWEYVHNDYLEIILGAGVIGFFALSFLIINTYRNFNFSSENLIGFSYISSLTAFLIIMLASFPMEFAPSAFLGMLAFCGSEKL